jgi:hypothetical protein
VKIKQNGSDLEVAVEGPIGEDWGKFDATAKGLLRIVIDASKMTFISSMGVKNWILWTRRIHPSISIVLKNCPLVLVNQAATVVGFMPPKGVIESFNAPFTCPKCSTEVIHPLKIDQNYTYASATTLRSLNLPKVICPSCKAETEPDFIESKTFAFLDKNLVGERL